VGSRSAENNFLHALHNECSGVSVVSPDIDDIACAVAGIHASNGGAEISLKDPFEEGSRPGSAISSVSDKKWCRMVVFNIIVLKGVENIPPFLKTRLNVLNEGGPRHIHTDKALKADS
jgi:hypothetical protein